MVDSPTLRITDMEDADRPRERLARLGAASLSNAELLAILLRVGTAGENVIQLAQRVLNQVGGVAGLMQVPFARLVETKGLGTAKAAQVLAAVELGARAAREQMGTRPKVTTAQEAFQLFQGVMTGLEQETVWVLLLDTKNRKIDLVVVYRGSLNSASIRVAELFREAIRQNAASILIAHNHPSGDPTPSPDDVAVTRQLIHAGKLLEIELLDHLVIGHNTYRSLRESRLAFGDSAR